MKHTPHTTTVLTIRLTPKIAELPTALELRIGGGRGGGGHRHIVTGSKYGDLKQEFKKISGVASSLRTDFETIK